MPISGPHATWGAFFMTIAVAAACPATLAAQTGGAGWQTISQPGGYVVARVSGSGLANGIGLTCERGVPVLAVNLQRPAPTNPVRLSLDVYQDSFPVTLVRNGRTNVWVAAMRDVTPIDALANGSGATLSAGGRPVGTFALSGARAAITRALASCYSPSTAPAPAPAPAPPSLASAAATAANFAGVGEGKGCPPTGPVARWGSANVADYMADNLIFCGDFTGDGAPDAFAVIRYALGGNNFGQEGVLFQNVGGQLRFLRRVPEFYGTPNSAKFAVGKVTLAMTVMLPTDTRCCPTGKEIREVDATSGRHWRLIDAKPATLAGKAAGPLSKLPIALGPYVGAGEACRSPNQVTWFEPGGFWEINRESRFFSEIAKVTRDGADYLLEGRPEPGDEEVFAVAVRPAGRGRLVMTIQDDVAMKLCKPEEIPARFRP